MSIDGFHCTSVRKKDGYKIGGSEMEGVQMSIDKGLHSSLSGSTWVVGTSSCRFFFYRKITLGYICCWSHISRVSGIFHSFTHIQYLLMILWPYCRFFWRKFIMNNKKEGSWVYICTVCLEKVMLTSRMNGLVIMKEHAYF